MHEHDLTFYKLASDAVDKFCAPHLKGKHQNHKHFQAKRSTDQHHHAEENSKEPSKISVQVEKKVEH